MKTKFTAELEAAGKALYTRQAHGMGQMAAWQSLAHTVKEEYCRWAAEVLRAVRDGQAAIEAVQINVDIWPEDKPKPSPNSVEFISREEAVSTWQSGIDAILVGADEPKAS